jgi:hypothetical protein
LTRDTREAVLIQQGHEQLEGLVIAVVGRGCHQQQVAGMVSHPLAHVVALGALHFNAEVVGAHAVGFIDHQVPHSGACSNRVIGSSDQQILQARKWHQSAEDLDLPRV